MTLSKCKECGNQVSNEAKIFPNCGVSSPALQAKKETSKGMKWFLYIIGFSIFGNLVSGAMKSHNGIDVPSQASSAVAKSLPHSPPEVKPSSDDVCRDKGDDIATAYFANINQDVNIGLTASAMMSKGCQQEMGSTGTECVKLCEDGFRYRAKQWVKS